MEAFIVTGAIFFVLSFILTVKNAKYLLSGFNTMSKERQKLYDINAMVKCINNTLRLIALFILLGGGLYILLKLEFIKSLFLIYIPISTLLAMSIYYKKYHSTDPLKPFDIIMPIAVITFIIIITL